MLGLTPSNLVGVELLGQIVLPSYKKPRVDVSILAM